jgi:hypothetical protein
LREMREDQGTGRADSKRARLEVGLVVMLLLLWLVTWLPRFQGPIDLRWDAAVYYTLGTALADGKGYRLVNEPGEIEAIQYPPGLPAIVALHQLILGTSDPVIVGVALRWFNFVISGVYVAAVYWFLRGRFGPLPGFFGATICALSMNFVWLSDRCYSDVPFLLAATVFMVLARQPSRLARFGTGTAAVTAFLLRTLGAALLVAWVADAATARHWRRLAARLLLAVLLVGGWQGYVWTIEHSPKYQMPAYPYQRAPYLLYNVSYATNASLKVPFEPERGHVSSRDVLNRFIANVRSLPGTVGEMLSTSAMSWSDVLQGMRGIPGLGLVARWRVILAGLVLLGLLTLAGLWYQLRAGHIRESVFVVTYLLALCVMNFTGELGRYLGGIQPFLITLLFTVVLGVTPRKANLRTRHALMGVLVCTMLLGEGTTLRKAYGEWFSPVTHHQWGGHEVTYRLFSYPETFRSFDAGVEWVRANAAAEDVVASSQPHWVYLRTGRRAVMPPFERDPERHQALLDSVPVSYVIVDSVGFSPTREYALPVLRNERRWELVYESADDTLQVFRRRAETPSWGTWRARER